jgi:hypothetical protein
MKNRNNDTTWIINFLIIVPMLIIAGFAGLNYGSRKSNGSTDLFSHAELKILNQALRRNKLGIDSGDLESIENPGGKGIFIFVEQTRFSGVKRKLVWFAKDGTVSPLNAASKGITPTLKFPRELPESFLDESGHDAFGITRHGIKAVFK